MPVGRLARRALLGLATSPAFERAARALPGGEERAWRSARRYVAGRAAADAIAVVRRLGAAGLHASVDLFGERAGQAEARQVAREYEALCARLHAETPSTTRISLDLSHLAFDADLLHAVAAAVPPGRRLQIGAEEAAHTDRVLELVLAAAVDGLPVEATVQANLRRSPQDAGRLAAAGVPIRLVKGAYAEAGALPWGPPTDAAYADLARQLRAAGADVALATHDGCLRERLLGDLPEARCERLLGDLPGARCELLLGIQPDDATALAATGRDVRVYVPYGAAWFRYHMRRRAEAQGA